MRFVPARRVHELLDYRSLVETLAVAHRGQVPLVERSELHHEAPETGTRQSFLSLSAWLPGRAMGVKMITVMPENEKVWNLPTVQAVFQLFDGQSGEPLAAMDGAALTLRKTAADSALGAQLLAPESPGTLLVLGAGAMAPHLIAAHCAVRPSIESVWVWNRTSDKAERIAADMDLADVTVRASEDLQAVAREADIISCATSATEPLLKGAWLKPGCHLDLVGSFTPEMRESDDEAVRRSTLFVDSRWFAIHQPGDLAQPIANRLISEADIAADLFELCRGEHPGRTSDREITLFKNGGGAHLDLFAALHILDNLGAGED